jgi:RNA polymerase sigma-70 factor (ECF subfamily)
MNADGDQDLKTLFAKNYEHLCSMAYNMVIDIVPAKEIVQRAFVKLSARREQDLPGVDSLDFLKRLVVNGCYQHLKSAPAQSPNDLYNAAPDTSGHPNREEIIVRRAIQELPAMCRIIYLLSSQQRMDYSQIAEYLGVSEKTIEKQMGVALMHIHKAADAM